MLDNLYNAKADTPSKDDAIDLLNVLLEFDVGSCLPVGYAICLTFLTVVSLCSFDWPAVM